MKVAINTLVVASSGGGGETYLTNLVRHISHIDSDTTYYLFVSRLNKSLFKELGGNFKRIVTPVGSNNRPLRAFYQQVLIPYHIARHGINLLLSYGNIATLFPGCKQVLIVDGAQSLRKTRRQYAPHGISRARALYFDVMLPLSLRRSSHVITVSQFMKDRLVEEGGVPPHKVSVVHEGVDVDDLPAEYRQDGPDIPEPYILHLSDLYRHKNVDKLLQAFSILKASYGVSHKLAIVGMDRQRLLEPLRQLGEKLGVLDDIIFVGPVPHGATPAIYRKADVFVHPSAFESFGLPVLEAMACGTPVVASNRTAIPEVAGDAGLIVDPEDVEALADAIYKVIAERSLREQLLRRGYERVNSFKWEEAARKAVELIQEVGGSKQVPGCQHS